MEFRLRCWLSECRFEPLGPPEQYHETAFYIEERECVRCGRWEAGIGPLKE